MFSKFLSLEPEKQERILNAAMKEFAQKGYKNASTNEIVTEANISKGLLFHYFNNKKDLYLYLYDYILDMLIREFFEKIRWDENDILMRLRHYSELKIEIIKKHPEMFNFTLSAYLEQSAEIKHELNRRNKDRAAALYDRLFVDFDTSKFKEGTDIQRAIQIMIWTFEGFSSREQQKINSITFDQHYYDEVMADLDQYLDVLRKTFYREM
ncbi:HTH-type transcriptional regulator BetI [Paenibacillus allorhizosphaerae]|uniref:HTH-type transcriptional regulator BetI n=2 Tax=Paenibacillus allorhizosphaerae TaxID=2849866 RepID=A0ABM8VDE6_9BACL|nr:TetR/AcrR family transcriptional regulator [Paenibacillus allorhizosphaerae]CAG7626615.1 HTH-type transcriptional regulator BetI [Paenibacillus allorhizosphaerae]